MIALTTTPIPPLAPMPILALALPVLGFATQTVADAQTIPDLTQLGTNLAIVAAFLWYLRGRDQTLAAELRHLREALQRFRAQG